MVVLNNLVENDLLNMSKLLNFMNIDTLFIFSIIADEALGLNVIELEHPSKIKYIEVGLKFFIENYLENPNNAYFWEHNKNSLYIMRDSNYSDIKGIFTTIQNTKVSIVRGSSQKSHMISPIDFRLSCYLMVIFNMDFKRFNYENSFNIISKDRYLPSS
jgi:hypothetical protein